MRQITPKGHYLGYIPDIPDHRDLHLGVVRGARRPPLVDMRQALPPAYDQLQMNSCAANAAVLAALCAATWYTAPPEHDFFYPSRLFAYYISRFIDGGEITDDGTTLRSMMKALAKFGMANEDLWPYDQDKVNTKPPDHVFSAALIERLMIYQRVQPELMREALATGYPVVFGIALFESFESADAEATGVITVPQLTEKFIGGHAMLAVGYDDDGHVGIVRNSWSPRWGKNGDCFIPYDLLLDPRFTNDCWTLRSLS